MEKRILQDVLPPERSSRKIPARRPRSEPPREVEVEREEVFKPEPVKPVAKRSLFAEPRVTALPPRRPPIRERPAFLEEEPRKRRNYKPIIIWSLVFISIAIIIFAFSLIYSSATVKIAPKVESVMVDDTLTAKKTASAGDLQYEVMTITKETSENVTATPGAAINSYAKGMVVFYNTTKTAQKLLATTALSNTNGQIYKLDHTITIPAAKTVSGKLAAGSISMTITASAPGAAYNMNLFDLGGDFKVVAYKGSAKYDTIYARLKTDITGGLSGVKQNIAADVASSTKTHMEQTLTDQVLKDAKDQTPDGYILFDNANVLSFQMQPTKQVNTTTAALTEKATFYGIIFKKDAILKNIADKEMSKFNGGVINNEGLNDLNFTIVNKKDFKPQLGTPLTFSLKGTFSLIGKYPEAELKNALAGKNVHTISTLLADYGTISSADVIIRPFWKQTFPNDVNRITIESKQ